MKIFGLVFPKGLAFAPRPDGMWAKIHCAINDTIIPSIMRLAIGSGRTWDARQAIDLDSLADEYGAELFRAGNESLYREYLRSFIVKDVTWHSQSDRLQQLIRESGFTEAVVVKNNKLDDPRRWTQTAPIACCGNRSSVAGNRRAICGYTGFGVLSNWPMKNDAGLNNGFALDGNISGVDFRELFGSVVFICSSVSYDANGHILSLTPLSVSIENKERLTLAILRGMPSDCVAVMAIDVVNSNIISETGYEWESVISETGNSSDSIVTQIGN